MRASIGSKGATNCESDNSSRGINIDTSSLACLRFRLAVLENSCYISVNRSPDKREETAVLNSAEEQILRSRRTSELDRCLRGIRQGTLPDNGLSRDSRPAPRRTVSRKQGVA
jgi:hypothetical protein